jgi:hypothetical protein
MDKGRRHLRKTGDWRRIPRRAEIGWQSLETGAGRNICTGSRNTEQGRLLIKIKDGSRGSSSSGKLDFKGIINWKHENREGNAACVIEGKEVATWETVENLDRKQRLSKQWHIENIDQPNSATTEGDLNSATAFDGKVTVVRNTDEGALKQFKLGEDSAIVPHVGGGTAVNDCENCG